MDFQIGGPSYVFGFEYFNNSRWDKYLNTAGDGDLIEIKISDNVLCVKNNNKLVFDNANKKFVIEMDNNDYSIEFSIWGRFERVLLLGYGLIIFVFDLIITLLWSETIRRKNNKVNINN